jgi:hypothetical protein
MGFFDAFNANNDPSRVPNPSHRHAAPSAPWPWVDLGDGKPSEPSSCRLSFNFIPDVDQGLLDSERPPVPDDCDHADCSDRCWKNYPKSRFPNWTDPQVRKCGIRRAVDKSDPCRLYYVDVDNEGKFTVPQEDLAEVTVNNIEQSWKAVVANKVRPVPMELLQLSLMMLNLAAPAQPQSKSCVHRRFVWPRAANARSKVSSFFVIFV